MSITIEKYEEIQQAHQLLTIIKSMKVGGWKADLPLIQVTPTPGIDTLCGEDFLKDINKELEPFLKKINRKILNRVNKVHKQSLKTVDEVAGLKEKLLKLYPMLDPDYKEPTKEEEKK